MQTEAKQIKVCSSSPSQLTAPFGDELRCSGISVNSTHKPLLRHRLKVIFFQTHINAREASLLSRQTVPCLDRNTRSYLMGVSDF